MDVRKGNIDTTIIYKGNKEIVKAFYNNRQVWQKRIYYIKNGIVQQGSFTFIGAQFVNGVRTEQTPITFNYNGSIYIGFERNMNTTTASATTPPSQQQSLELYIKNDTPFDMSIYRVVGNFIVSKIGGRGIWGNLLLGNPSGVTIVDTIYSSPSFEYNDLTTNNFQTTVLSNRVFEVNDSIGRTAVRFIFGNYVNVSGVNLNTNYKIGIKDLWLERK